jgi:hypothetical protein
VCPKFPKTPKNIGQKKKTSTKKKKYHPICPPLPTIPRNLKLYTVLRGAQGLIMGINY